MTSRPAARPVLRLMDGSAAPREAPHDLSLAPVVLAARAGDPLAWEALVRRFDGTLRAIARSYRLAAADVDDVVQATWHDLVRDIHCLREPAAVPGWLVTAARRKAMRQLQTPAREVLTGDPALGDCAETDAGPDDALLAAERREALAAALATLPARHRELMTVLASRPCVDYREAAALLAMPVGSIGPIRARSLARLARDGRLRALVTDEPGE